MKRASEDNEVMPLTEREVRILVALSKERQMTGYEIALQVDEDSDGQVRMSNGTLRPALERLHTYRIIEEQARRNSGPGLPARIWRITSFGRMVLAGELASYRRLVRLGDSRG